MNPSSICDWQLTVLFRPNSGRYRNNEIIFAYIYISCIEDSIASLLPPLDILNSYHFSEIFSEYFSEPYEIEDCSILMDNCLIL